ncbi:MAG: molybdopterin-dependent oxidoreductase, partial [Thermomicrobiaceae bacterium]|nr:molybdopterin-dependent oxidoreductase [Thermomicrobiaceae bacterium]
LLAFRGRANTQGATDMGCHPAFLPGYQPVEDAEARAKFEAAWLPRWRAGADGLAPLDTLPATPGLSITQMIEAIDAGRIKAMYIAAGSHKWGYEYDRRLLDVLPKLEFLVVEDCFPSELTELAHVVLPGAMFLEKEGSFTNADRTIQRVRYVIAPPGDAQSEWVYVQEIAQRLGYDLDHRHPSFVLEEAARLAPIYAGVSFPRLERGPLQWPVRAFGTQQTVYLRVGDGLAPEDVRFVAD